MFKLRTHMAWSTLRLPVRAPEGNWHLQIEKELEITRKTKPLLKNVKKIWKKVLAYSLICFLILISNSTKPFKKFSWSIKWKYIWVGSYKASHMSAFTKKVHKSMYLQTPNVSITLCFMSKMSCLRKVTELPYIFKYGFYLLSLSCGYLT